MLFGFKNKKKYYYVQRCPECKSRVTGRYIPRPKYETDADYLMRNSLIHGEWFDLQIQTSLTTVIARTVVMNGDMK